MTVRPMEAIDHAERREDPPVILDVEGLSVDLYAPSVGRWSRAVDNAALTVRSGETVGLVGESGCGKTISMLSVLGLTRKYARVSGSAAFDGRDLIQLSDADLRHVRGSRIGTIFQQPTRSLNPAFTVGEQIAETLRHHRRMGRRESWNRAVELLDSVAIPDAAKRANEYPHTFSGGMCQRVMIALALSCDPALLIADEPTTALDVTVQARILELLREIQTRTGIAIVLVSHDLGVIAEMCSRVYVMYAGHVVEAGSVRDVLRQPRHPYTEGLVRALPENTESRRLQSIRGNVPPLGAFPAGCHFSTRCDYVEVGRCDAVVPELIRLGDRHVRCVRAQELSLVGDSTG